MARKSRIRRRNFSTGEAGSVPAAPSPPYPLAGLSRECGMERREDRLEQGSHSLAVTDRVQPKIGRRFVHAERNSIMQ